MSVRKPWTMTNGIIEMDVCSTCAQPYREGHVDCSCPQNHPERCERPTYEVLTDILETVLPVGDPFDPFTTEEHLANARRISGDNANIAVKAMGMLADAQETLGTLIVEASHALITVPQDEHWERLGDALDVGRDLIAKQKETKLYD